MSQPVRLLMLCLGNICRSPMAEGAFRAHLAAAGLENEVQVDLAGIGPWHAGDPPDPRAIACARGHGVDIADLRGRQVQTADFARFDWILAADEENLRALPSVLRPKRVRACRCCCPGHTVPARPAKATASPTPTPASATTSSRSGHWSMPLPGLPFVGRHGAGKLTE